MRSLKSIHAFGDEPAHPDQIRQAPFQVGESLPLALTIEDMCRAFRFTTRSGFCKAERRGEFARFELKGRKPKRWSGALVAKHLAGNDRAFRKAV